MLCPSCGNQVPDGFTFCTSCGNPLMPAARSAQARQAAQPAAYRQEAWPAAYQQDAWAGTYPQDEWAATYRQDAWPMTYQEDAWPATYPQDAWPMTNQQDAWAAAAQPARVPDGYPWIDAPRTAASSARAVGAAKVVISIAIIVIVIAAVMLIGIYTQWFGMANTTGTASAGTTSTVVAASQSVSATTAAVAASQSAKPSVNDYTWDELSAISKEISASGSEDAALQVAEKYNLCTPDGRLDGTQTKSVTLSDGTQAEVQIAGFYHDDKSDGSGKAGITFIFKDAVAEHEMNPSDDNTGGWQSSEMRSWLSSDFMSTLPADLANDIVTVDKLTNNMGETTDTSSVSETQDAVWLFSSAELCGAIGWYAGNGYDAAYDAVLNTEGTEYQLFSDSGVSGASTDGYTILMKNYQSGACYWALRSASPDRSDIFCVVFTEGCPSSDYAPNPYGVVPGFCI